MKSPSHTVHIMSNTFFSQAAGVTCRIYKVVCFIFFRVAHCAKNNNSTGDKGKQQCLLYIYNVKPVQKQVFYNISVPQVGSPMRQVFMALISFYFTKVTSSFVSCVGIE